MASQCRHDRSDADDFVVIVDDDATIRTALTDLFTTVGLRSVAFASATELLEARLPAPPRCFVLDIRLPQLSGLDLQRQLARDEAAPPVVFMTGHGDVPMTVKAMKAGAVDFLTKPFRAQDMLDAVAAAMAADNERRRAVDAKADIRSRYDALTPREKEILPFVAAGLLNKQIAHELGLAEITVKIHRGKMKRKLGAGSVADLVRVVDQLGLA